MPKVGCKLVPGIRLHVACSFLGAHRLAGV